MKTNSRCFSKPLHNRSTRSLSIKLASALLTSLLIGNSIPSQSAIISNVDTSLSGSQKFVLRVAGQPWYMTNVQVRLDKLRYWWGFDAQARDLLIGQAASDGFNTVSIPIHWYEVEPTKDNFNWAILDEYLSLANKYNIRMELLWFGSNSGGHVQWLGDPSNNTYTHLRTPDYVLYSPAPGSSATTSDYPIVRSYEDYTLDLNNSALRAREAYVLGQVMEHIASWDASHGNKRTVIGVQLGNEVRGPFTAADVVSWGNAMGAAVKNSSYSVWTRMNCVWGEQDGRVNANEALRSSGGTNVDFVGVDVYTSDVQTIQTIMPTVGQNFKMIMEAGAEVTNAYLFPLAALSGDSAFDFYEMLGPDAHGLYDRVGSNGWTPNGTYINEVRKINRLQTSAWYDLAVYRKQVASTGLYVHNYRGNSTAATPGVAGINFTPASTTSQGVSVKRSVNEFLLINTQGGTFTYPSTLGVTGATRGYLNASNAWVSEGGVSFTSTQITPPTGTVVRLTTSASTTTFEAETLNRTTSAGVGTEVWNDGASGGAWVKVLSDSTGDYVELTVNVPSTGNYSVVTGYRTASTRGIAQLAINGTDFGSPIDMYQATATFTEAATPVTFGTVGNKTFRYRVTGRNASSTNYQMSFDYIRLIQQ